MLGVNRRVGSQMFCSHPGVPSARSPPLLPARPEELCATHGVRPGPRRCLRQTEPRAGKGLESAARAFERPLQPARSGSSAWDETETETWPDLGSSNPGDRTPPALCSDGVEGTQARGRNRL